MTCIFIVLLYFLPLKKPGVTRGEDKRAPKNLTVPPITEPTMAPVHI